MKHEPISTDENGSVSVGPKIDPPSPRAARTAHEKRVADDMKCLAASDEESWSDLSDLDRLRLDPAQMTSDKDLFGDVLDLAQSMQSLRSGGYWPNTRAMDVDAAKDADRFFRENAAMEAMIAREPELLRLIVANRRLLANRTAEVERLGGLDIYLRSELVRRRMSAEGWRYLMSKASLPIYSVLYEARLSRDAMRAGSKFHRDFVELVHRHAERDVSIDDLNAAARKTEQQFEAELRSDRDDGNASPPLRESAETLERRLGLQIGLMAEELAAADDDDVEIIEALRLELKGLSRAAYLGAGMNAAGQIVLPDGAALAVALDRSDISKDESAGAALKVLAASIEDAADEMIVPSEPDQQTLWQWPTSSEDREVERAKQRRSLGLGAIAAKTGFFGFEYTPAAPPFAYMPLRPDHAGESVSGPIDPKDIARFEVGVGMLYILSKAEESPILGRGHALMLPPHTSIEWYGQKLGWSEASLRRIRPFGDCANPETITAAGDFDKLMEALRGVVELRLREMLARNPTHKLSDPECYGEAVEDLARWWYFILLARHNLLLFDKLRDDCFLHGVHGPDFVIEGGRPVFGKAHFVIMAFQAAKFEPSQSDEELKSNPKTKGLRRRVDHLLK